MRCVSAIAPLDRLGQPADTQPDPPRLQHVPSRIMEDPRQNTRPIGIVAGIAIALVIAGAGVAWWVRDSRDARQLEPAPTLSDSAPAEGDANPAPDAAGNPDPASDPATNPATAGSSAEVYFLKDTGTAFELVATPLPVKADSSEPDLFLSAAFEQLLATAEAGDTYNAIPPGTELQSLNVTDDDIRVNLSSEFTSGGGSASMMGRLGQVVYTATSLDPDASVWLSVDGEPLELLGGEGLMVPQPITRSQFDAEFSL